MDYLQKSQLIVEFTEQEFANTEFDDFFDYNDIGVPLAIALSNNLVTLTNEGEKVLEETYIDLCNLFEANPNKEYESIEDLIG